MVSKMKKLAMLSLAVSQGKAIHNKSSRLSKTKKAYFGEMNKILASTQKNTSQYRKAINILRKLKTRSKRL